MVTVMGSNLSRGRIQSLLLKTNKRSIIKRVVQIQAATYSRGLPRGWLGFETYYKLQSTYASQNKV
jgi:hypothetical protein